MPKGIGYSKKALMSALKDKEKKGDNKKTIEMALAKLK